MNFPKLMTGAAHRGCPGAQSEFFTGGRIQLGVLEQGSPRLKKKNPIPTVGGIFPLHKVHVRTVGRIRTDSALGSGQLYFAGLDYNDPAMMKFGAFFGVLSYRA